MLTLVICTAEEKTIVLGVEHSHYPILIYSAYLHHYDSTLFVHTPSARRLSLSAGGTAIIRDLRLEHRGNGGSRLIHMDT